MTIPMASAQMPACFSTNGINAMLPPGMPAVPMDTMIAARNTPNCWARVRSLFSTCAMNSTATAWYRAVPSMFTVAPMGSMKLATFSSAPMRRVVQSIVTGRVAELDEVLNDSPMAGAKPRRNRTGDTRAATGSTMPTRNAKCSPRPVTTVRQYQASERM